MEEKKNKTIGKTVTIIILVVLLLGAFGYIGYDHFFTTEKITSDQELKNEKNVKKGDHGKELDVNSRLVRTLYNKVSTGESSEKEATCRYNYMYVYNYDDNSYKDFYVDQATEEQKMELLSLKLNDHGTGLLSCHDITIPDKMNDYTSICSNDKTNFEPYYYKNYIEMLYKDLYGNDATLDTSKPIYTDEIHAYAYHYISSLDKYMQYRIDAGGVCGPIGMYGTITKAIQTADSIKIYEKVTTVNYSKEVNGVIVEDESYKTTMDTNYVYTFKLDSDGMYNFISRVKEG